MVVCRVILLDQEQYEVEIAKNAVGQVLFDNVKQRLNLEEADYFGLSYRNSENTRFWLNLDKRIDKQVESTKNMVFSWEVKFYPPAPEQLNEDLTRYLIVLQIRQDLFSGRLPASFHTLAVLGSYTAQGEVGDFDKSYHLDISYLTPYSFAPKQSEELLIRIFDLHKNCKGLTPAEADLYFLDNAKKCALYGMDMYTAKDSSNREVKIGVCASGLYVYHGRVRMESFKWPRMLKISYKTNIFHIKVRPAEFEHLQKTLGFKLPNSKLSKRLWRIAVENHQFFRLKQPELTDTSSLRGFGSRKWRMSGRTQAQLRNVGTPRRSFSRCNSMSSDNYPGLHQSTGTMPVPALRRTDREPDVNRNYNTFAEGTHRTLVPTLDDEKNSSFDDEGRGVKGTDKLVDISYDGDYVAGEQLDDSAVSRDMNSGSHRRLPTDSRDPLSSDNLVNGDSGREVETDLLPSHSSSFNKTPNGQYKKPTPKERIPNGTADLTNGSEDNSNIKPVTESAIAPAGAPQFSNANSQPSLSEQHPKASLSEQHPKASLSEQHPKAISQSSMNGRYSSSSSRPSVVGKFGIGELPMPSFSLESAGVMPTGAIDKSAKLPVSERAEKIIKVGMPPTVRTTCMKFADGSSEPTTHSTWSPPTVKTEKKQFNYIPNTQSDLNSHYRHSDRARISETTTFTTERDGYIEKKVKHTITLPNNDDIDDQRELLLDAIQAVTGLDSTLGVDKIEIKTETECP